MLGHGGNSHCRRDREEDHGEVPHRYSCAPEKTYPHCMAQLSVGERHDLIAEFVDAAKLNWAHLCIAQLMRERFVDRVYATNFDQLVTRASAMLGIFPAVYDFAASQLFKPAEIPDLAVFNLHGQRTGFVLLNTSEEVERLGQHLSRIFDEAGRGRVWIVVGYSGQNDPVFERLAEVPQFDNFLYWVGYADAEPSREVRDRLLLPNKGAFFLKGHDADSFFVTIARELECFPPPLIARPFSHLKSLIDEIAPFREPGERGDFDVTRQPLAEAERLSPGSGSYDLACLAALRGDFADCRRWLETSKGHGRLPSWQHVEADGDLAPVRNEPWYADLLASISTE